MTANTVNVNVTDDVISLNPESDAFIGGRAFNLHALPDDFQVNLDLNSFYIGSRRLTILWRVTDQSVTFSLDSYTFEYNDTRSCYSNVSQPSVSYRGSNRLILTGNFGQMSTTPPILLPDSMKMNRLFDSERI